MTGIKTARGQAGFTLAELLVTASVMAIILGGLLSLLMSGSQTWMAGANRSEAQQSTRLVLQRLAEEVRTAGWDPRATTLFASIQALPPGQTGFIISNDWSANGTIETNITTVVNGVNRGEQITYDYVGTTLRRRESQVDGAAVPVTDAITDIQFTYRDADDVVVASPHLAANAANIRTVEIAVTTTPDRQASATSLKVSVSSAIRARVRNRS